MKHVNDLRPLREPVLGLIDAPETGAAGPQGDALILELQRLQRAFDEENGTDQRATSRRNESAAQRSQSGARGKGASKGPKKKGRMRRTLDICLRQFGLRPEQPRPHSRQRRPERPLAPEIIVQPRRRSAPPAAAHGEPMPMNPRRLSPEIHSPLKMTRRAAPGTDSRRIESERVENRRIETRRWETAPAAPFMSEPQKIEAPTIAAARVELSRPAAADPLPAGLPAPIEPPARKGRLTATIGTALTTGITFLAQQGTAAHLDAPSDEGLSPRVGRMFENELRTGLRILVLTASAAGGWLVLMPLAGAVVVPGNLVVQSNVKAIQHPTGGIVAEIKVQNGMHVAAGDLLIRLDATQTQASLQVVSKQLDEMRARIGRLTAERDGNDRPQVPPELASRAGEDNVTNLLTSEDTLFKARLSARQSQKDLLESRISQLSQEITGLESQLASKGKELDLISGELKGVQELFDKRLVPLPRLTALQREGARIEGERGQLTSTIAETKSKVGEAQLQMVRVDQDFRSDVVKDLVESQGKEGELVQRSVAAQDQLNRIEIRAPTAGFVHQLATHTIGGVIRGGDTVMEIVPDSDDLQIEAHVPPNEIDHVRTGQDAFVRLSAFNQRTTPQLNGKISFVSATTSQEQQNNGNSYYTVRISLSENEVHRLGGLQLIPGMPAEVFMQTGNRTMMTYLLKPITDQMRRAFVEN
jgi:HlyD family secretion protein